MRRASRASGDKSLLGAVFLLAVVGLFVVVFLHLPAKLTAPGGHRLTAVFADAQTLATGDPVRLHGVQVGTVTGIDLDRGGRSATVSMSVSDDALPLYADARATVRWRSLFGAAFVIDLDRGTPALGPLRGGALDRRHTATQVLLEDLTTAMAGRAREGTRAVLREFPRVLADREVPRNALQAMADTAPPIREGMRAVQGQRRKDLGRLVANSARTVRALDAPSEEMNALVSGAATTFATTARRRADISRALVDAADTLPRVRRTARRLDGTLRRADPLLASLDQAAPELVPTAARLDPTLAAARGLLSDARPLLSELRPAVASLASASRTGAPVLAELRPILSRLDQRILPGLAERSAESNRTGYQMIGPGMAGLLGSFSTFDNNNNFLRFTANFSEKSVDTAPCRSAFTDPKPAELVTCEALVTMIRRFFQPGSGG
jgi:phospholipid/cholesterol/gamma-HCH transport system substrate-binding protein